MLTLSAQQLRIRAIKALMTLLRPCVRRGTLAHAQIDDPSIAGIDPVHRSFFRLMRKPSLDASSLPTPPHSTP